MLHFPCLRLVH
ncbi:hypothetical protein RLOC_00008343 [Lonchura striata]|uniref:Uncharacterized protein n=1 Tax=Lonchura striata TaxID=40157 RepID=A0A218UEL3_9PASE|nr:hypothetical protein RLOC_00008343 [Lonchura striata domestica]